MKPDIFPKQIYRNEEATQKIIEGITVMYDVARAAYGPKAGNVMYEHNWPVGASKISRDGVTNLEKVTLPDRAQNIAAKAVLQASKRNNQTVGDGTTAVTILTYHLYMAGHKLVAAGHNRMDVAKMIEETAVKAIEYIDSIKSPFNESDFLNVAKVACGDEAIAELLAQTVAEVGADGGITVEEHNGLGVYAEVVDGLYLRKGFSDARLIKDFTTKSSDFENAKIFITEKVITESKEMDKILNQVVKSGHRELLIIGEVINDAREHLVRRRGEGLILSTLVGLDAVAGLRQLALNDLSLVVGGRVYTQNDTFTLEHLGSAKRVLAEELCTTIMGGEGDQNEVNRRIEVLEKQLETESHPITTSAIRSRILRLRGKVGIVKVGAATDIDREELRLRVDDAVCALQATKRDGTVPGGGSTLARVTGTPFDEALQQLFIELVRHSNDKPDYLLGKILEKPIGYGYDLKNMTPEPIDMREAGIVDPTLVIKEVVRNAASVASLLTTNNVLIVFSDQANDSLMDMVKAGRK